ncbi:hypothetical protein [Novosphingobium sp.]|uniref:hypothetical protein n=1 Tax=Novosphingobium sp. TaxID=1874826 RepID=UPI0031E2852B
MTKKIALTPAAVDTLTRGPLAELNTPGLAIKLLGTGKKRWQCRRGGRQGRFRDHDQGQRRRGGLAIHIGMSFAK